MPGFNDRAWHFPAGSLESGFVSMLIANSLYSALLLGLPIANAAYTWKNVKIGGGGGFVPGIVFHPKTKGVAFARTDIGGLYKLNSDDSWTPLTDKIATNTGWSEHNSSMRQ